MANTIRTSILATSIKRTSLLLLLISLSMPGIAAEIDFNLGKDAARVVFTDLLDGSDYGRKEYTMGLLYNTDDNVFFDASMQIVDEAGSKFPGLEVGVGPKVYLGQTNTQDYLTFGIAALANYRLQNLNRFIFNGYAYFSPSIVSFIDADQMWELHVRAGYEMIPSAVAYVGFRRIRAKVNARNERTIDSEFHFGVQMDF